MLVGLGVTLYYMIGSRFFGLSWFGTTTISSAIFGLPAGFLTIWIVSLGRTIANLMRLAQVDGGQPVDPATLAREVSVAPGFASDVTNTSYGPVSFETYASHRPSGESVA